MFLNMVGRSPLSSILSEKMAQGLTCRQLDSVYDSVISFLHYSP